jgi:hypothetical protein
MIKSRSLGLAGRKTYNFKKQAFFCLKDTHRKKAERYKEERKDLR